MKKFIVPLVLSSWGCVMHAQELPEFDMNDTTVVDCQGILYDSGGETGIYTNNENLTFVINPGQGIITITFQSQFCLENNLDFLSIYNGPTSASPLLGTYTGTSLPPSFNSTGGAITLVMTSDNNVAYCGFQLEWSTEAPDPLPPALSVNVLPNCNASNITVNLAPTIPCAWLLNSVWMVDVNGDAVNVNSATPACNGGNTNAVVLALAQPFSFNCDYTIHLHIEIPDACLVIHPFELETTFTYDNCGVNAQIVAAQNPICPGGCTQLTAEVEGCFNYTYSWNNGLPATAGPHTVCPAVNTAYSCTITEVETGNISTEIITVTIETNNITTLPQTVCQSAPNIVMTAQGSGVWSGEGIVPNTNQFDPDLAGGGITYVYFQTASCEDSVEITVTPIATQNVTAACPGSAPFQLIATPGGGTWAGPNTDIGGMFDPVSAGVYTVQYTVNGCTDDLTVNVDDIGGPFALDSICQSIDQDQISFSPYGGVWSGTGITNATEGIYEPQSMPVGNNTFTYTINGCNQIFNIYIKQIEIGGNYHTTCPDEAPLVWYDPTPLPAGGMWFGAGISISATGLFDPGLIANNTETFIYYVAPNGCVDTMYIFNLRTEVDLDEAAFCINDPVFPLDVDNVGEAVPSGGIWSGAGVTQPSAGNFVFTPSNAGVGPHTIYYEKNNCQDSIAVSVFPTALNISTLSFCANEEPVELQPGLVLGGTWSGNGIIDPALGIFDPGVAEPGNFKVYWNTPAGCNDSIAIFVDELAIATISGLDDTYCAVDELVTFSVSPEGGNLTGSLPDLDFNPSLIGQGDYQVIYNYTPLLCPATADTVDFTIYPPLTTSIVISDDLICEEESTTITVDATGGDPAGSFTFTWSNGGLSTNVNTSVPGVTTTIYVITDDGCSTPELDSALINVLPPMIVIATTSPSFCAGEPGFAAVDVLSPGSYSYFWNNTAGDELFESPAGTSVTIEIEDLVNGCTWDSTVVVPSYPVVAANFNINPATDCIDFADASSVTFVDLSQNATQGTWNFGSGGLQAYDPGQSVVHAFASAGNFTITLTVEDNNGCTDSLSKELCILPDVPVFIPDIFSPNADGVNDVLYVRGVGFTKMEFYIYNRWGEEVFYSNSIDRGWDGQLRGRPAMSGNYYYSFKASLGSGKFLELTGEFALIR
ncbi:MAG: gliding motility-associated C-terminal domain-containing protein [Flavobacteriales bacterium]